MSKKNSKNNNLVLLKSIIEEHEKLLTLNEEENDLKNKLELIEDKLLSIEKVTLSLSKDKKDTMYDSAAFNMLIGSIAIAAAINTIAEYFGISSEDVKKLID